MNDGYGILIASVLLLGLVLGAGVGAAFTRDSWEVSAVKQGYGDWVVEGKAQSFEWKDHNEICSANVPD